MAPVLAAARAFGALDPAAFAALATVGGLTPSVVTGVLLFVAGGATVLPLPYVTLSTLLPGRSLAEKGAGFAAATWAGFVVAFYVAQAGVALWTFLVLTLAAHLAYGCVVGGVYDRLAHRSSGRCSGGP